MTSLPGFFVGAGLRPVRAARAAYVRLRAAPAQRDSVGGMDLNPYARFLGDADPVANLAETPERLGSLLAGMSPARVERPRAPGKWNTREIVAHLADCELVFGFRLRQTLSLDGPVIQPFDQGVWAERYASYDLASAMALFFAARAWNLRLLARVSAAEWERPTLHPERGTMTLRTIAETMAGHDRNHLLQLEEMATRS